MNLHLERRLEVLAREIAASKAPKIDAAANALFEQIGRKHEHKAPSDWARKINGAAGAPASATCETGNRSVGLGAAPPSAQKFKVGDRVRAISDEYEFFSVGDVGFIVLIEDEGAWVFWNESPTVSEQLDDEGWLARFSQIEHAPDPAATPVALEAAWVGWSGGVQPTSSDCLIEYQMRNGDFAIHSNGDSSKACALRWTHTGGGSDIVAYRKVLA